METSRPWEGITLGDSGPYSDEQWRELWRYTLHGLRANMGPIIDSGSAPNLGLQVQATSPASAAVDVLPGSALVAGSFYLNDAIETLSIAANVSGNPRIDTVVLTADYTAQTVRVEVLTGTPAATPAPPALTQVIGTEYQIPIVDIAVANGFVTIGNGDITPRQEWANAADGVYLNDILNNSGVTLETGNVVIWDTSTDRAVTRTTTFNHPLIAGVWVGRTNNAGYGRVLQLGIGYVQVDGAYARGTGLFPSTTAGQAGGVSGVQNGTLGVLLEASTGAGQRKLAIINVQRRKNTAAIYSNRQASGTAGPVYAAFTNTVPLNTEVTDESGIGALAANRVTIQPGLYYIEGRVVLAAATTRQIRAMLYNAGLASYALIGTNADVHNGFVTIAMVSGYLRINAPTTYELHLYSSGALAAATAVTSGDPENYAELSFIRIDQ